MRIASPRQRGYTESLDWLLSPYALDEFVEVFWEKNPVHIEHHDPGYFTDFFALPHLDRLIATSYTNENIRLAKDGQSQLIPTHGPEKTSICELYESYYKGNTLVFRNIHQRWPSIHRMGKAVANFFGCKISTHLYATPRGSQGFGTHWDDHDIYALQLEGEKEWLLYEDGPKLPLPSSGNREYRRQSNINPQKLSHRITLKAGDLLYFPRGTPHLVKCTEGKSSLHLTFGIYTQTYAQLLKAMINCDAHNHPDLQAPLPFGSLVGGADTDEIDFSGFFESLSDENKIRSALNSLYGEANVDNRMAPSGHFKRLLQVASLSANSSLRPVFTKNDLIEINGSLLIAMAGIRHQVDPVFTDLIIAMAAKDRFRLAELELTDSGHRSLEMVKTLIKVGLCHFQP